MGVILRPWRTDQLRVACVPKMVVLLWDGVVIWTCLLLTLPATTLEFSRAAQHRPTRGQMHGVALHCF